MAEAKDIAGAFKRSEFIDFGTYEQTNPLNYIHPYKSPSLEKILRQLPENVELMVVYGSSAQDYQREDSDLDLAVIPYDEDFRVHKMVRSMGLPIRVDIQMFRSFEDLVEQANDCFPTAAQIIDEGILVYCRGNTLEVRDV
jgi:predicted nucleotidyltransferase